jgi:hypothetical protein
MKSKDFSWDEKSPLNEEFIPTAAIPKRFALTAPQVAMKIGSNEVLLIDPHATGTWETWMFPYASLILTCAEVEAKCTRDRINQAAVLKLSSQSTFRNISIALKQLRKIFASEYTDAIGAGVNNVLPQLQGGWNGKAFYENYSLKFSKTSMSYTAYAFDYYINTVVDIDLALPHVWVDPKQLQAHLKDNQSFEGRAVSTNVVEAIPAILNFIKA